MSQEDTIDFDILEKLNILIKNNFNVVSTRENIPWYNETSVKYNKYIEEKDVFIDNIPVEPQFIDVQNPSDYGLQYSDFFNGSNISGFGTNNNDGSLHIDTCGVLLKFTKLRLDAVPGSNNNSYYKLDNNGTNQLANSFQFNKNMYFNEFGGIVMPFRYILYRSNGLDTIISQPSNGNMFFDFQSGIVIFPDYNIVSSYVNNTDKKPYFSFVKYIGRRGINILRDRIVYLENANVSFYKILEIKSINVHLDHDFIVYDDPNSLNDNSGQLLTDFSLNTIAKFDNSKYKIYINLNYIASKKFSSYLNLRLYYKINNDLTTQTLIGDFILGTDNSTFTYDVFNKINIYDINCTAGSDICFYFLAYIYDFTMEQYYDHYITPEQSPKILYTRVGNSIVIEEINRV